MDECVGNRVRRAMVDAGVGVAELAGMAGILEGVLADRLAASGSFTVVELVLIAAALRCDVLGLLPDSDGCDS
ncbi:hypothetical protein [Nocardia huaxiensis]|uniref:HTH cro/C1-type domain-containing protein n=1 Tax=Nocardia huaxiensis TaxID=2755382 RepID=A0A7D6ZHS3_9NOCA|nr:hypothetical protein [Nocardia huaxiensis]QLY30847.1 hypothetical protein H0264_38195 [Nocardia huaxiensis]UFS94351.1 hypothetical protein LPY97_26780 [Nocardia huaxiensis]